MAEYLSFRSCTDHVSTLPTLKRAKYCITSLRMVHPRAPVARRWRTGWFPGVDSWTQGANLGTDKNPSPGPV